MLKGKLKLPEKARLVLPDRIGNLVVRFDEKDEENAGSDSGIDFGEELEALLPYELGSDRESDGDNGKLPIEEEKVADDSKCRVRPRLEKEVVVSVSEAIAADEKRSDLQHELSQNEINLERLQRIASTGLPDGGGLRATTWKLLLGYLPPSRELWEKELIENRLKYAKLKEEFLLSPSQIKSRKDETLNSSYKLVESNADGLLQRHEISQEDHPLSLGKASAWNQFFQHTEIIDQIDRDLQRTHPDMKFFSGESSISRKNRESMKNVLLLFAKVNPAISYVQGMNEVLAPIYYLFSTDPDEHNAANVEADSFSCFVRLLSDLVDHFCEQLDNSSVGILSTLSRLSELLKENDEELWRHLELTNKIELSYLRTEETSHLSLMEQIKAQYYGFRWITLLLTQEFNFHSIMRIWDSLLSNPFGVQDMLLRICCAMLLCMKSRLMRGDFVSNLKLLQHYPDISIEHLLDVALDISPDTSSYRISLYGRTFIVVSSPSQS